ncbi:hypothetical protein BGX31_004566, partial [Mortierella sp. GBA43]
HSTPKPRHGSPTQPHSVVICTHPQSPPPPHHHRHCSHLTASLHSHQPDSSLVRANVCKRIQTMSSMDRNHNSTSTCVPPSCGLHSWPWPGGVQPSCKRRNGPLRAARDCQGYQIKG